jgi:hypothetical protein
MTDEEADALDERLTRTTPAIKTDAGSGPKVRHPPTRMVAVDDLTAEYLTSRAMATHKSPTEVLGELVRKELTASA